VFLNIALEMPLGLGGLLILTIDLLTEQVRYLIRCGPRGFRLTAGARH
jgi:hypothetical protein